MSKNLIPIIAKELGVAIGEEFGFETNVADKLVCRFTDKTIQMKNYAEEWLDVPLTLNYICQQKVIKLPFKPVLHEEYWTYDRNWNFVTVAWSNNFFDYLALKNGCVFRTYNEVHDARMSKYEELTGQKWSE